MNLNKVYLEVIKVYLFKDYLDKVVSKYASAKIYVEMCEIIVKVLTLLYQCQLFIENAKKSTEEISYGLGIYRELLWV